MASTFPSSQDTFKTIPTPTITPTNLSDASDDTLSTRLQQHSDAIAAVEAWLIAHLYEPPGVIKMYGGTSPPVGYINCDGSAVSRTTFSALFSVIGTNYGIGNGSTTFNVPDLRGRIPVGIGTGSGLTARSIGGAFGEENHQLTPVELASHSHSVADPTHNHGTSDPGHVHGVSDPTHNHGTSDPGHAHGVNDPTHSHLYTNPLSATAVATGSVFGSNGVTASSTSSSSTGISIQASATGVSNVASATGVGIQASLTGVSNAASATGIGILATGSDTPHNNLQPSLVVNFVIKT